MKFWNDFESLHLITSKLKYPWKSLTFGIVFFIIAIYLLVFKLSFHHYQNYWIGEADENVYMVNILLKDEKLWQTSKTLVYDSKEYDYRIISKGEITTQGNELYLPLKIEINSLIENLSILEISLLQEEITIWDYLKTKVEEE